jgi:hypothetical protein
LIEDSASILYGSGLCGAVRVTLRDATTYEDFLTFDTDTGPNTLTLESLDFGDAAEYDLILVLELEEYPEVSRDIDFKVTVEDCPVTSFTPAVVTPILEEYIIGSGQQVIGTYDFTQDFDCGYPFDSLIIDPALPPYITHNVENQQFLIDTDNLDDADSIAFGITAGLDLPNQPQVPDQTIDVQLDVTDPCLTTEFTPDPYVLPSIEVHAMQPAFDVEIDPLADTASTSYGVQDGFTLCGPREYYIINPDEVGDIISIDGTTLTLDPDSLDARGDYEVHIGVRLVDYPQHEIQTSFPLTVAPCPISDFTIELVEDSHKYVIGTGLKTVGEYVVTQDFACGYPVTITYEDLPAYVTTDDDNDGGTLTVDTLDLTLENEGEDIIIKVEIQVPDGTEPDASETTMDTSSTLNLEMESPC